MIVVSCLTIVLSCPVLSKEDRDSDGMSKEDKDLLLCFQKAGSLVSDVYQNMTSLNFDSGHTEDDEDLLSFLDDDDEGRDRGVTGTGT
jgi:hypothetical protein